MAMENILDKIVADKRVLVERYKSNLSHDYIPKAIERRIEFIESYYSYFDKSSLMYENRFISMKNSILKSGNGIIAEFKRRSPSKGDICKEADVGEVIRSEEHTSELQSHSDISSAVFCLKKKKT